MRQRRAIIYKIKWPCFPFGQPRGTGADCSCSTITIDAGLTARCFLVGVNVDPSIRDNSIVSVNSPSRDNPAKFVTHNFGARYRSRAARTYQRTVVWRRSKEEASSEQQHLTYGMFNWWVTRRTKSNWASANRRPALQRNCATSVALAESPSSRRGWPSALLSTNRI